MVDLRAYFLQRVDNGSYYARFKPLVEDINTIYNVFGGTEERTDSVEFLVFDEEEAISKFRESCQPGREPYGADPKCWFVLLAFYLDSRGYYIEQFPNVLARPPIEPSNFVYDEIRNRAFELKLNEGNTIPFAVRRQIVANFTFKKKANSIAAGEGLEERFRKISTGDARFDELSVDEKLEAIANLIENMLKVDGSFASPDYPAVTLGFVGDSDVRGLRNKLQCFRHSHVRSLAEREQITSEQKAFLVDYGITVCKAIHVLVSE